MLIHLVSLASCEIGTLQHLHYIGEKRDSDMLNNLKTLRYMARILTEEF